MNVTPSQREFENAHRVRLDKFWPQRHSAVPAKKKRAKVAAALVEPPAITAPEWFSMAWGELGETSNINIRDVQHLVCEHFAVPYLYMTSTRRSQEYYLPRNIAMYLCRKFTDRSYPAIGRMFHRDHTTVVHNMKAVEKLIALGHPAAKDIEILSAKLGAKS